VRASFNRLNKLSSDFMVDFSYSTEE